MALGNAKDFAEHSCGFYVTEAGWIYYEGVLPCCLDKGFCRIGGTQYWQPIFIFIHF